MKNIFLFLAGCIGAGCIGAGCIDTGGLLVVECKEDAAMVCITDSDSDAGTDAEAGD